MIVNFPVFVFKRNPQMSYWKECLMNQVAFQNLIGQLLISNLSGLATLVFWNSLVSIMLVKISLSGLSSWASPRLPEQWKVWIWQLPNGLGEKFGFSDQFGAHRGSFVLGTCFYLCACTGSPFFFSLSSGHTAKWWWTSLLEVTNSWMVLEKEFPTGRQKK